MFTCLLCNTQFKMVSNTHLKHKHGITCKDYKKKFPGAKLCHTDWFEEWRNSEKNKSQAKNQLEIISVDESLQARRKSAIRKAWNDSDLLGRHSTTMKHVARTNENFIHSNKNKTVTPRMRMSNYDRWVSDHGVEEANKRQLEWQSKNIIPTSSRNTKQERQIEAMLIELNHDFIKQYPVLRYYCDFYLPKLNVVIEHFGNYHHANPVMYEPTSMIVKKSCTAQDVWKHDEIRLSKLRSYGHGVLVIWQTALESMQIVQFNDLLQVAMNDTVIIH